MDDALRIAAELLRLALALFEGSATPADAHRRVREILPEKSASEQAAEDIEAGRA